MTAPKILIVASADSSLLRERVQMTIDSGHDVVWYSESISRPDAPCRTVHAKKIVGLGPINKAASVMLFFLTLWKHRPDLVHIHWALFTPLLFKRAWPRLVVSVMGSDVNLPGRFGQRRLFARLALSRARIVTSKSKGMDRAILALGDFRDKLRRISWGLDASWFVSPEEKASLKQQMGIDDATTVFFSPRWLSPLYRVPQIIRSFAAVRRNHPSSLAKLYVAGETSNSEVGEEIRELVRTESLDQDVIMLGALDRASMLKIFTLSDVVLSYAASDGMPQSLYEAMATCNFPIFTDLPCYAEILEHERNALLCSTDDPASLATQMTSYLTLKGTPREREILRENAERVRSLADKAEQTAALHAIYDHLLSSP